MKYRIKQRILLLFIPLMTMIACFEEDTAVLPYPGDVTTIADSVQAYQSFFDFETGSTVKVSPSNAWQLGFECGNNGWHIITNSGAGWFIYNTMQGNPDASVTMPSSIEHLYDIPHDFPDSTAVGNWVSFTGTGNIYTGYVYLLGQLYNGKFIGIKKLIFDAVDDTAYFFRYTDSGSSLTDTVVIGKKPFLNFTYFSFDKKEQVDIEPTAQEYDLVFGPYYDLATNFGITIPYMVGGALLNTWNTTIVIDTITDFNRIDINRVPGYDFTNQKDIPGYKWKSVTVDISAGGSATYNIKSNYTYIIHTATDNYFKFRFLSYTLNGRSGYPQFEMKQLN